MMKFKQMIAAAVCIAALAGCSAMDRTKPVLTPTTVVTQHVTADQVKQAILTAGQGRNWIMTVAGPGVINATQNVRDHSATVRINYSEREYSIHYVSSVNLMASGGEIHRAYNHWVNNLDNDIKVKLAVLAASPQ
ncbi:hypothetical protein MUA02_00415 [Enterobacteriaceae bacterium H20N1]|uniref:Lipoprotein n=1 Tax=Dryocola boscaweniae TaxID=2925397 RepID=A0A9X3ALT6_9ENTR|nr:hypothetical protein [Dryocola boscaweniae]MCT4700312.1 hypothetical protein [Dryocola boscaweniae]MCT4713657.1 hypothetical protein [Dryocola boscaweniae]MCT4717539.1 hypothetical protein [Dryocola boscaweniae]